VIGAGGEPKSNFSCYFAHLFLLGAKNLAMMLPAAPLLYETKTVPSFSFIPFIFLFNALFLESCNAFFDELGNC
jgi:hypothetical protein